MTTVFIRQMKAIGLFVLFSCVGNTLFAEAAKTPDKAGDASYQRIEWTDLLPKEDFEALSNPPAYLDDIVDGSPEDQIADQMQQSIEQAADGRYQQALVSTQVVAAFNKKRIKMPGFIVPLEFDEEKKVTQFFLVPYFGACIHVPPPPPNQIVFAVYPKGLALESLYDPFWLSGILETTLVENDVATSAYTMKVDTIIPYYE